MMQRNPFSTCFTRPGRIPFVFPDGQDIDSLLAELSLPRAQWAIIGPHGSGKSTLLEMLSPMWEKHGLVEQRVLLTASGAGKSIPLSSLDHRSVLVIDGFEQLSAWRRWWIRARCWQLKARLLVTCHEAYGVPIVLETRATWPLAYELVKVLLPCEANPYRDELKTLWDERPGNIREYLFRLYHWCESRGLYREDEESRAAFFF